MYNILLTTFRHCRFQRCKTSGMQYVPENISHDGHNLQINDEPDEGDEEENDWNKNKEVD